MFLVTYISVTDLWLLCGSYSINKELIKNVCDVLCLRDTVANCAIKGIYSFVQRKTI